jgi:hypothetical protein
MRVTPAHLGLEPLDHLCCREFLALLAEHQLEGEMQQQVAELSPNPVDVAIA